MSTLKCERCGYDLSGLSDVNNSMKCPECGQSITGPLPELPISHAKVWIPTLIVLGVSLLCTLIIFSSTLRSRGDVFALLALLAAPTFGVLNWIVTTMSWVTALRKSQRARGGKDLASYVALGLIVGIFTSLLVFLAIVTIVVISER